MGAIRSIRKFYSANEADIVIFLDRQSVKFEEFCSLNNVSIHLFSDIENWVLPLVYQDPAFSCDVRHFYHPNFRPVAGLDHHTNRAAGFDSIRHLHPFNVKAYCTGYCLCISKYDRIVYLDPYAFLLSRLDDVWSSHPNADEIIAFASTPDPMNTLDLLFDTKLPETKTNEDFAFSAGIVFYNNGPGVRLLAKDFMFYSDSCYHWTHAGSADGQGILRALVAKHCVLGNIDLSIEDAPNWNPVDPSSDSMTYDKDLEQWINDRNGRKQYMWRGEGPTAVRPGHHASPSIYEAWTWAGGVYTPDWSDIYGALTTHNCNYVATLIAKFFANSLESPLAGLEIGTYCGRTSIAFCTVLQEFGFKVHIDTCDIFAPTPDYPTEFPSAEKVRANIREFGMESLITSHHVGSNENLLRRFGNKRFDFVYIDGSHEFKQVAADIVTALKLVKDRAIIVGDDFNLTDVQDAVYSIFVPESVMVEHYQWSIGIEAGEFRDLINLLPASRRPIA